MRLGDCADITPENQAPLSTKFGGGQKVAPRGLATNWAYQTKIELQSRRAN